MVSKNELEEKKGNNCNNNNNKEKQKRGKREIGTKKSCIVFQTRINGDRKENLPDKVYREVFCFRITETKQ